LFAKRATFTHTNFKIKGNAKVYLKLYKTFNEFFWRVDSSLYFG